MKKKRKKMKKKVRGKIDFLKILKRL